MARIGSKKSTSMNKIPPKLIKLSTKMLSKPLGTAIDNSFNKVLFPNHSKIASVSPLDKHTDDKY